MRVPIREYCRRNLPRYFTDAFACSQAAGEWLFGKHPFQFFPIGIDMERYKPNEDLRDNIRSKMNWEKKYVIGMVASLSPIKNHPFIIQLLKHIVEKIPNAILALIGDGAERTSLERLTKKLNLENHVFFAGIRTDVPDLLQGIDLFVPPSISEGFPVSVLEAESSGIPCVLSTGVPKDIKILESLNTSFLDTKDPQKWMNQILKLHGQVSKRIVPPELESSIYNVKRSAKMLTDFYEERLRAIN